MEAAATAKVKRDHCDQEGPIPNMTALVEETKEKFVAKARSYVVTLLEIFLGHLRLNANIVCGMACFDPKIILCLPLEQANFCFTALYQSFSLRGWLEGSPENDCRDEYLDFVGLFRQAYHSLKDSPNGFSDMVNLLSSMPELRNRAPLYRFFQLSCMCLTENTPLLPSIRFHDVDAQRPKCSLGDVLLPAQSYLARVPEASSVCIKDDSLSKLREIEKSLTQAMWLGTLGPTLMCSEGLISTRFFGRSTSPSHRKPNRCLPVVRPAGPLHLLLANVEGILLKRESGK